MWGASPFATGAWSSVCTPFRFSPQRFDFPALAIFAADAFVGGGFVEFHRSSIPFKGRFWEMGSDAAEQHGLGERRGVTERRGSQAKTTAVFDELTVVIAT